MVPGSLIFSRALVSLLSDISLSVDASRCSRDRSHLPIADLTRSAPALSSAGSSPLPNRRLWLDLAILVVMLGAGGSQLSARQLDVHLRGDLDTLDNRIDDWTIEIGSPSMAVPLPSIDDDLVNVGNYPSRTGERRFIATDEELVRVYRNPSGNRVRLYIGYYHRQEHGKELTGDTGAALALAASPVTVSTESRQLDLNEIVRTTSGARRGVLFWYDVNGRIVSDFYRLKSYTIWDAVTRRRTNGAVVMIAWDDAASAQSATAREDAIKFARALLPVLRRHLPA